MKVTSYIIYYYYIYYYISIYYILYNTISVIKCYNVTSFMFLYVLILIIGLVTCNIVTSIEKPLKFRGLT
jgi:hypothetical protein